MKGRFSAYAYTPDDCLFFLAYLGMDWRSVRKRGFSGG